MFGANQLNAAKAVLAACRNAGLKLATAESCTGGLISGCLTAVAGSSDVVDRGFVTYTNEAKSDMLGVPSGLIDTHGAVSEAVARAMAEGALMHSAARISVAVTGIAGPGGGTAEKPVGLVHIACARDGAETLHECHVFDGGRDAVRAQTVSAALEVVLAMVVRTPTG
ncbi:MAG: CinA family protein [Proteobacteria bacterium]|nr:CinA family protein [Pseudomonadota bacterium]